VILYPGTPTDTEASISKILVREEGLVLHAYPDSKGLLTIGIGTMVDERAGGGITLAEAYLLMGNRLAEKRDGMDHAIPWWRTVDAVRRDVLLAMAYQMGVAGLLTFNNTLEAARLGQWRTVAAGIRSSKWAKTDSPARAERMAQAMETGKLVP
jgi:lysozyme